jgi:hypothetical protein
MNGKTCGRNNIDGYTFINYNVGHYSLMIRSTHSTNET